MCAEAVVSTPPPPSDGVCRRMALPLQRLALTALMVALVFGTARGSAAQTTMITAYGTCCSSGLNGTVTETPSTGTFFAGLGSRFRASVEFRAASNAFDRDWRVTIGAPFGLPLQLGTYENTVSESAEEAWSRPTLEVRRAGGQCSVRGAFTVLEIVYGLRNTIERLSFNFLARCTETGGSFVVGSVRINATSRASHQVTVTATGTGGGAVTSIPAGVSCGAACTTSREEGLFSVLTASPSALRGVRWSGDPDCSDGVILGGASVSCTATYEACATTVTPASLTLTSAGPNLVSVVVQTNGPDCTWSVSSAEWPSWAEGNYSNFWTMTGSQVVRVQVRAQSNQSRPRTATLMIAGQPFTLTQPGLTPTTAAPESLVVGPGAGVTALMLQSNVIDDAWTTTSESAWISVPSAGTGLAVPVSVERNVSPTARTGRIVVGGRTVVIVQHGNGVPGEPMALSARVEHGIARFTWAPPQSEGDAISYRLEAGVSRGGTAVTFAATAPVFDLAGVPDGRFFVRVRGINEFGVGVASDDYVLDVQGGFNPPDPPTVLTPGALSSRLELSWAAPSAGGRVEGYVVEAGSRPGLADLGRVSLGMATSFAYRGSVRGTVFLSVRAVNRAGVSRRSAERMYSSSGFPSGLLTLTVSAAGGGMSFAWEWPPSTGRPWGITHYRLVVGSVPGGEDTIIETTGPFPFWGLSRVPPGRYYVRVQAVNANGAGPASNEVYVHVR